MTSVTLSRAVGLVGAGADSTTLNALVNQRVLTVTGTTITATDFDGEARPYGAAPDIGADELRYLRVHLPLLLR